MTKVLKLYGVPGSGKTHAMLDYFEVELQTVKPNRIAFLTFTRTAKGEALARSGRKQDDLPYLRTIHSICYRQLDLTPEQMVRATDLRTFGNQIGKKISGYSINPWDEDDNGGEAAQATIEDKLLQLNHLGRHKKVTLREALVGDRNQEFDFLYAKWFTQQYRTWRDSESLLDYTDILTRYLQFGAPLPIEVLFVDEAQDLSLLQWEVIHKLGANAQRWYLAGDDDQAVFSWAGASASQFIVERADDEKFLQHSYRVPRSVAKIANRIINKVKERTSKHIIPRDADGAVRSVGEISFSALGKDNLILFRNHHRGKSLATDLLDSGIPFAGPYSPLSQPTLRIALQALTKTQKKEQLAPFEIKALLSSIESHWVLSGARDLKNRFAQGLQIIKRLPEPHQWPDFFRVKNSSYVGEMIQNHGLETVLNPPTNLLSIHQAKGMQADKVFLDLALARKTFDNYGISPDDEHRVFYVAVTRAKEELLPLLPSQDLVYDL